jgi:hypothetical protein
MRTLTIAVLAPLAVGCMVPASAPPPNTVPPPHGPTTSGAPDPGREPFQEGVSDPRIPSPPASRDPVAARQAQQDPPRRKPPVAARPTVTPTVAADSVDKAISNLASASGISRKRALILVLGRSRDPRAVDALVRTLKSRQPATVRAFAAEALGRLGASWSIRSLSSLLSARSTKLRTAARKSLAKVCRSPRAATLHYLRIAPPRDFLPKRLLAGRLLLLSLAKTYSACADCVLRWPACSTPRTKRRRRLAGFELQPRIKVTRSGDTVTLKVSVLVLTHPQNSLKGSLEAKATFDVELSRPFVKYVLQSLSDSLKGDIDALVRKLRQ